MTQIDPLRAGRLIERLPLAPDPGLVDHLLGDLQGLGNPGNKGQTSQVGSILLRGQLGIRTQRAGRLARLELGESRRTALFAHRSLRRIAVPTRADKGHTAILRHHQLEHGLLQVRAVIFGRAVGDGKSLYVGLGHIRSTEGEAGRVQTVAPQSNPFVLAHRQRDLAAQRVAAVGEDCVEAPSQLEAVAMRRQDALAKEECDRLIGEKLWGQGEGAIGKAQSVEDHPGHGFAGTDVLLGIGNDRRVDHVDNAQVFDNASNDPSMVQAFHGDRCHMVSLLCVAPFTQSEDKSFFIFVGLLNVGSSIVIF